MKDAREQCLTRKVPTRFGSLYVHLGHDASGRITEIQFSSPGKFDDTTVGEVLIELGLAATALITEVNAAGGPHLAAQQKAQP